MHMMVHCPGCHQALQVPTDASGRYARCPVCRTKFIIPNPDELFEETVSTWIEEDLDQYMWEQEESADQADAGVPADQPPQRDSSPRDVEQQVGSEDHEQLQPPDERPETPVARRAASQLTSGDTMVAMAVPESAQPADKRRAPAASRPAESERAGGSIDHDQHQLDVQDQEDLGSSGVPIDGGSSANEGSRTPYLTAPPPASITTYPQQLHVTEPIPRLAVKEVFQQGVTFCFDSLWVEHDGFRASFPVACAFCGAADRKHLMSKPMAFADRAMDKNRSAREIENDYEHGVRERSPAQLLQVTGRLAGMLKPFASPVLYYTCSKHHQQAMECTTVDRSDGGITCEVLVPDRPTALLWLSRVNGVCGPEYALLERDVTAMSNETWDELPDSCRQRLAVWCKFAPGERFREYLPDADLARHDAGLAGVVITDDRLIYHKYRLFGEIRLDTDATLVVRRDDRVAVLSLDTGDKRVRIAKLHARDLPQLIVGLSHAPGLKVTVAKASRK